MTCPICSQVTPGRCPNYWCRQAGRYFDAVFAIDSYDSSVRRGLLRFKYGGERGLAPAFAAQLASYLLAHPAWFAEFDVLTSAPSYVGAGARRPWDHVGAVVSSAAGLLGPEWAVEPGLVMKRFETPAMAGRSQGGRRSVARGPLRRSLALAPGAFVDGARVLVFDDVMTEGSTLRETARALRQAGTAEVGAVVLARPVWGGGR